jgi:hypothetical protein
MLHSAAGYMCAILTLLAKMEENVLATGRSPYMFGAAPGCDQQPKSSQRPFTWPDVSPLSSRRPLCPRDVYPSAS